MLLQAGSASATALKNKLISQAVKDPLFKGALKSAAAEIAQISTTASNEATIESAFERILYSVLKDIGLRFHPEKEQPIKTRRHTAKGRTDSRVGALVIEYKQPSTLSTAKAIEGAVSQLSLYLDAISEDAENDAVGFLTDGTKILEIRSTAGAVTANSGFAAVDERTLLRLVRAIVALESSALNARNLIRDFCGDSYDGTVFRVARELNEILGYKATIKTEMLRTEWEALFRLAHEDQSQQKRIQERRRVLGEIFGITIDEATMEYRALFSLHTAYAIILKLIAFRVVSDVKFKAVLQDFKSLTSATPDVVRAFCSTLEDGEIFRQIGILNLLEGDFFSWYSDPKQWNDKIAQGVKDILITLARYEDVKSVFDVQKAVDLFRSLYEATVPQIVRGSFGEFYTPYWLAEQVLETSRCSTGWTAIDPCCGSGTFVIAAISKLRQEMEGEERASVASAVLSRIYGIDLNPLAVLTARIHYFIHIADLLEEWEDEIVIPVFLGDASNVPVKRKIDGVDLIYYELKTLKTPLSVYIPVAMARDTKRFTLSMFEFERLIRERAYDEAKAFLLKESGVADSEILAGHLSSLADQIIELERKEWNGIWARIIANFITTACVGPFSNIIGNPPWIDWKSLPAGYREKVKGLCVDRGLFSGAGRTGGINLNVCALITHVAAANWLQKGGHLAFLMPKELANQASYEGWRKAVGGASFSLIELHDWSKAGHPFDPVKEDFMTFIFEGRAANQQVVPVTEFRKTSPKSKAHQWISLPEAKSHLTIQGKVAGQIVEGSTAYTIAHDKTELASFGKVAGKCAYIGREGIEFYPQELMLFLYDGLGPKAGTVWVKNIQVSRSKYKIPQQKILLETKFLYPLAKGPNILPFTYQDPGILVAFPYVEEKPHAPLTQMELKSQSPLLLQHYRKFKEQLEQQTKYSDNLRGAGEFYGVARTGPYSFKDCYVAFRDNTKWCAAVLTKKVMPWGEEKRYLFQNHAVSICESETGHIINETEAHFVAGIFNTAIVRDFINASSDNRSFKIRPPVYVPTFEPGNIVHDKIAQLAKQAASKSGKHLECLAEIQKLYIGICETRGSLKK
ncbi:hypothetical protein CN159_15985 [Sinorhizobium meliloti]|uniref:N-6 DNA methylase n=1 Tax=Rhizobium meliloti TaxID=382 RepID=UPI000FD96675|nr:N-6 DNA methylase [Sinorhizobium meliloti]RVK67255.1 hypothetical protein CN159_15985 [Sinorhizobium meliloti]